MGTPTGRFKQTRHQVIECASLVFGFDQADNSGILGGAGKSGDTYALGATADNGLEFYMDATHTTGDMRGHYLYLSFSGAGGSGEAFRARGVVNNVSVATGGTVNGAHITLELSGASSAVSGAGNALRATLGLGAGTTASGTLSGIQVDADFASDATLTASPAGIRFTTATSKKWPIAFAFDGVVGTGNAIEAATSSMTTNATAWALHITVDGTSGYIPVFDNKTWS